MDSFFQSTPSSSWSYDSLKNLREISPVVQNHLKLVYLTLCCALASAAVGSYLHILFNIGGLLTALGFLGTGMWLIFSPPQEERKKFGLLMVSALSYGAVFGLLVEVAIEVNPSILVTAFVGTAIAFGCFSGAAIIAKRREFLFLGGILSSCLTILLWLGIATIIFGSSLAYTVELYFGLVVFLGYIVFDTQYIIERGHNGDLDYVQHALLLFTDFVAVFARIVEIMLRKEENERKKKKRSS
ncbi:bax inhibitor 1-like [Dioscorea cayenensis subsp. rotundata]|uniref:Bax inhibitor 1-like n=1 Tax=Dioscorea cayennensis subsp. rotundata TaxID=55577 RepID=A0AB40C651_DIOCR|nr:bax inhibitor 1-like [Dioscorea cayenensis subsp. rotundata]